ncbi:nodulation protein NfeD [Lysinibacillus sp. CNPSo 3705]|uniref:NfeD family protein n=1 Tax=Lysinibacillus sp. CNPSo 3705 TaxID=3028148 RepID=UPI00236355B0|nr:nodulation protein NfeD [Lysinibacillus sp. CNPSo 3705]MDD1503418.1 nodulation protein NfeD [Lysinibacillus sp. CNPSo 3705]
MRRRRTLSYLIVIWMTFLLALPLTSAFASSKVYHIPIHNEVERGLHAFLERAFKEAEENYAEAIILDIHTPGGFVNAAGDIAMLMDATDIRKIAYINKDAHSAGAFLALHADEIYMVPNGTIGAAAVIDSAGNAADLKAHSAWVAQMEAAAESKNNRKPIYARAMADASVDLPDFRAGKGKLLTLSASEAEKVGYSNGTVSNFQDLLKATQLNGSDIIPVEPTFAEKLARFITNPIIVPILLSIASLGLVVELYSPGFGVPGIMGLSALGLFFFGHMVAGFAGYETLLLFIVGLALVVAEFFVPGGIVGILGGVLILLSLILAGANMMQMLVAIFIALVVAIIGMVILMKFFGKKLHVLNKLVLMDATTTEEGYVSNVNRTELLGKVGTTVTPLRPAGTMLFGSERIDVVSEGGYVDAGKHVEVIKVEGSRIVVRQTEKEMEE